MCKGHGQKLLPVGELFGVAVAVIAGHATAKLATWKKAYQLREDALAFVHPSMLTDQARSGARFKSRQAKIEHNHLKHNYLRDYAATLSGHQ